ERVGTTDTVLAGNVIDASDRLPHRIRIQFGVFDDGEGAAPAGGYIGWNVGSISVSGTPENSQERRTPGRLSPFNFAASVTANGVPLPSGGTADLPGTDWQMLTQIDATLGTQSPPW